MKEEEELKKREEGGKGWKAQETTEKTEEMKGLSKGEMRTKNVPKQKKRGHQKREVETEIKKSSRNRMGKRYN